MLLVPVLDLCPGLVGLQLDVVHHEDDLLLVLLQSAGLCDPGTVPDQESRTVLLHVVGVRTFGLDMANFATNPAGSGVFSSCSLCSTSTGSSSPSSWSSLSSPASCRSTSTPPGVSDEGFCFTQLDVLLSIHHESPGLPGDVVGPVLSGQLHLLHLVGPVHVAVTQVVDDLPGLLVDLFIVPVDSGPHRDDRAPVQLRRRYQLHCQYLPRDRHVLVLLLQGVVAGVEPHDEVLVLLALLDLALREGLVGVEDLLHLGPSQMLV